MSDLWKTHTLENGDLSLIILPGIGGRLWDVVYKGHALLFQNPDLNGVIPDYKNLDLLPTRSPQFNFPLWGGEKTWIAPDSNWINGAPYPTLDSGAYYVIENQPNEIKMQSQVCQLSGLQIERSISLKSDNSWAIIHTLKNCYDQPRRVGIWSVMMLNNPAQIGLNTKNHSDVTPVFGDAGSLCKVCEECTVFNCYEPKEFKLGVSNPSGQVFIRIGENSNSNWLHCTTTKLNGNESFAHGHNFEVFNSGDYEYCEAEWHAPAHLLHPGETTSFAQEFSVYSQSELLSSSKLKFQELELLSCMS